MRDASAELFLRSRDHIRMQHYEMEEPKSAYQVSFLLVAVANLS